MSGAAKKIGDRVRITAGQYKGSVGTLVGKQKRGAEIELEDGLKVIVPYPQVVIETEGEIGEGTGVEENGTAQEPEVGEDGTVAVEFTLEQLEAGDDGGPDEAKAVQEGESQTEAPEETDTELTGGESAAVETSDLLKMTVKQLQELAKSRGIGIARTKEDFLRIIEEKHPDEDLERLKGKVLFDRVSELHISRLRSKQDFLRLLKN